MNKKALSYSKKLWQMFTCTVNHQPSINNKVKPNESIPNTNDIIKWILYFSGFVLYHMLVAYYGDVNCRVYDPCLLWIYKQTMLESELDLLKYCNIDMLTSILTQNKTKHTSCCCVRLMSQKWEIGKKLANCCDSQKFFPVWYI